MHSKKFQQDIDAADIMRILIIDDHQMVRDGIKVMLHSHGKQIKFLADDAEDGNEAFKKVTHCNYDIILLDYNLSDINGADLAKKLLRYKPQLKILTLSNFDEIGYVESMIEAGAKGYILKNIEPSQLLVAIKTILAGSIYYSNEVAVMLLEATQRESAKIKKAKNLLSQRELEVLKLICMEKTNEEIAAELFLAKRTVDTHRQNLLLKLHAKNTVGLIKAAFKLDLIKV